jgi:hypothetical protein
MTNWLYSCNRAIFVTGISTLLLTGAAAPENSAVAWMTGKMFRQELERPLSATWTKEEFRKILIQASKGRGISVVLDRRLDPTVECATTIANSSLFDGLKHFADLANGDLSLPENFVYLGPKSAAKRLRTVIEIRSRELQSDIRDRRRSELQVRRTIQWQDLETPREILNAISEKYHLKISNLNVIPHDLWAESTLPDVTLVEALSVILIQFDLTFHWNQSGDEIELVSLPEVVSLDRKYRPKQKPTDALSLIQNQLPEIDAKISDSEITIKGTVEDHELVANLLQGKTSKPTTKKPTQQNVRDQSLTLNTQGPVSIRELMRQFEAAGVQFEYDADDLKAAGIDFEQSIQLDVKNVSASEFFKSVFDPIQVQFEFDKMKVKLKPKPVKNARD